MDAMYRQLSIEVCKRRLCFLKDLVCVQRFSQDF